MKKNLTVEVKVVNIPVGVTIESPLFTVSPRARRLLVETYGASTPISILAEKSVNDLFRISELGRKSIMSVSEALKPFGLELQNSSSLL